ncbi:MAG: hypothetical protein IPO30_21025 [Hyphomonadaceae bacterium]|nr:hypothetical protein [Hyphomonadaceae bacterium]MBP9235139.1 hypothetical protein [Hyphomonadaceae bacterium]
MAKTKPSIGYHADGTIRNKGQTLDGQMHGYWEFFRRDGIIMRSGHFCQGEQCGAWTIYDKAGKVHKVTHVKPDKAAAKKKVGPVKAAEVKTKQRPRGCSRGSQALHSSR